MTGSNGLSPIVICVQALVPYLAGSDLVGILVSSTQKAFPHQGSSFDPTVFGGIQTCFLGRAASLLGSGDYTPRVSWCRPCNRIEY